MHKYLIGAATIILILLISCVTQEAKLYPDIISDKKLEIIFDKAKWEIYKWNLLLGEDYENGFSDQFRDTIFSDFESLDLFYTDLEQRGDTLTLKFDFSDFQLVPIRAHLLTDVTLIDSTIIGLDFFNHLGVIYPDSTSYLKLERDFKEYLQSKEPSDLNPWLLQEAKKRGVIP